LSDRSSALCEKIAHGEWDGIPMPIMVKGRVDSGVVRMESGISKVEDRLKKRGLIPTAST
jgi:hypothetical protein